MKRLLCQPMTGSIALHHAKGAEFSFSFLCTYFSLIHPGHFERTKDLLIGVRLAGFPAMKTSW
jgi:hypothetical protein